jgi:hypothetical protein
VGLSAVLYAGTQLVPALDLGDAGFNPLAWQILAVAGTVVGHLVVSREVAIRISRPLVVSAAAVLIVSLIVAQATAQDLLRAQADWIRQSLLQSPAFSKTNLGIGRLAHFTVVAIIAAAVVTRWPGLATARSAQPFVWSGRHSLPLFCLGVVLAYLSALASAFLPTHVGTLLFLAVDAVLIQFVVAWLLERR